MTVDEQTMRVVDGGRPVGLLLTIPEAAETLRFGVSTVKLMVRRGELPVVRCGRAVRVPRAALEEWIAQRTERSEWSAAPWFRVA